MAGRSEKRKRNKKGVKTRHYVSLFTWLTILFAGLATLLCALFFVIGWTANAYYVSEAKKGIYHPEMEEFFTRFPFPDEWVIWYNLGNCYYDAGDYEEAESAYLRSIDCGIPYEKECPVKVNLALSMMAQISEDDWDAFYDCTGTDDLSAGARTVEKVLKDAREVLIADGCAHENDSDGHDKEAQTLKEEIDELLERSNLDDEDEEEEEDEEQEEGDDEQDDEDEEDDSDGEDEGAGDIDEEEIMEHIQDMLDDNQEERTDDQQLYEDLYGIGIDEGSLDGEHGEVW